MRLATGARLAHVIDASRPTSPNRVSACSLISLRSPSIPSRPQFCRPKSTWSERKHSTSIHSRVFAIYPSNLILRRFTRTMSLKRKSTDSLATADSKKSKSNGSITSFFGAPKASAKPSVPFDKNAWVSKLTDEQKDLLKLEIDTLHESWFKHLKEEMLTPEFLDLKRFIKKEKDARKTIYPPLPDVYSWSRHTPLNTVKVVVIGQDPYINPNQAHGMCFSVRPPTPAPPSLQNIYKALSKDYPSFQPPPKQGGLLTPWADRGVLLLNTCLTVERGSSNSHANRGWERFTQKVIEIVTKVRTNGVVFLAWGSPAQKRVQKVDTEKHLVLKSVHPSPLSAHKGFMDCGHFKKTNEWLVKRYGKDAEIDWNLNVPPEVAGV
ncbi:uracil-DNA glycosylase-like protein [Lineolata rhizophorae]|uniref:Uracil-DNA glycosylase n=1 Tax=Lineolata rhizophorae TaxID=578093 RepID=A0A6A6P5J7_9PEZI|nr:uracil-DNA glycosylase-like protein [Lineolata rhizophorae]